MREHTTENLGVDCTSALVLPEEDAPFQAAAARSSGVRICATFPHLACSGGVGRFEMCIHASPEFRNTTGT